MASFSRLNQFIQGQGMKQARSIYKLNKLVCSCDNVSGTSTRQQSRGSLLSSASILSVTSQQTPGHFLLTCLGGGRHVE